MKKEEEEEDQEEDEDMDDGTEEEEEPLVCGLCNGPCESHPDDPLDQDPICQSCLDKRKTKRAPTSATDPKTYFDHIKAWEKKRDTVLVESLTGFVFSVVKLSGMEIASVFEILGIDLETDDASAVGIRFHTKNMELLDDFIQPNIRSPVLHTSDTSMEDIPEGEVRVDKLHKVDVDAIMTEIMLQATGGDIPQKSGTFLGKSRVQDGRKARKKRGRNSTHGHRGPRK